MVTDRAHRLRGRAGLWLAVAIAAIAIGAGIAGFRGGSTSLATVRAALNRRDLAEAKQLLGRYLDQHPKDAEGWTILATLAEAEGDQRAAAEALRHCYELTPNQLALGHRYGTALLQSAQFAAAESLYTQLLQHHPTDETAQTELQWIYFHQLRERELEAFLEACLSREPTNHRLLYHLLVSAQKPPNPLESMPVLERIDAACPEQRSILLGMARCAWKSGEIAKADALFARVRALGPPDREFALAVAEYELEQGRTDAAAKALDEFPPDQWQADDRWWWSQSQLSLQQRDLKQALEQVSAAVERYPRSLPYQQSRLSLLRLLNRKDEATAVQADVDARRAADQRLYLIVHSGELDRPTRKLLDELATLCEVQKKPLQAAGWRQLANLQSR
jgi:predicted Zn-dependent protease